jgi:transcriptional regulator with XRE-family HTH domain
MATGKYQKWLTPDGLMLLEGWARDGLTDEQLARKMGISRSTLSAWEATYADISDALKKGKDVVDIEVENALLKRALGYEYTEVMVEHSPDGVKHRKTVKFIPPDVTAQIFWLKNRKPETWREKQVVEVSEEALERAREILGGVKSVIQ